MKEKAYLVTAYFDSIQRDSSLHDAAAELSELALSAGLDIVDSLLMRQKIASAPMLIGRGKAEEIAVTVKNEKAAVVVFESELSPSQQRNLEEVLGTKVIDRTQLILDIFAQRARSTEGKLQVELAQLKYLLPRLGGKGVELSRLGGGVGTRGPGEQKLEVDRRRIRERITKLSDELKELQKRRESGILKKKEKSLPLIALVGYTNAGKSTLFNRLTGADVFVKNQLFSTLDTTTRQAMLPGNQKALLVDTVGFVRDLPHHLIESFKATLEEAVHADALLHVVDAGHPDVAFLEKAVKEVLKELGTDESRTIMVLNKIDLVPADIRQSLIRKHGGAAYLVSAKTGEGLKELLTAVCDLHGNRRQRRLFVPNERLGDASVLYREAQVMGREDVADGAYFTVMISEKTEAQLVRRLGS
jgi:GTP-binding protein HflX